MKKNGFTGIEIIVLMAIIGVVTFFAGPPMIKATGTLFNGGSKNQSKATHSVQSERVLYQVDPQHPDKMIPVKEKYSEQSYALDAQEPPETFWTKFWHLGALAVIIIVVLSYLGLWPVVALWWNKYVKPKIEQAQADLGNLQAAHDDLSADAKLIVRSVDAGLGEIDKHIATTKATVDSAQADLSTAGIILDPVQRQATIIMAQQKLSVAQAVYSSVTNMKQDFKDALAMQQDTTTKLLVAQLKND
jgi:competence protein ComGC